MKDVTTIHSREEYDENLSEYLKKSMRLSDYHKDEEISDDSEQQPNI